MTLLNFIKSQANFPEPGLSNTIELLLNHATIPFIARYRKEATGNLNEVQIETIVNLIKTHHELEKRRDSIIKSISEQGKLSDEIKENIEIASNISELEDIYLPYKKKRKTKADVAVEAGLEPLAKIIMSQKEKDINILSRSFLNANIKTPSEAIAGARDIIAEWINENPAVRNRLRQLYRRKAVITSKVKKAEEVKASSKKYEQYFKWEQSLSNIQSHSFLALYRADKEGVLSLKVNVEKEKAIDAISSVILKTNSSTRKILIEAIEDAFSRLLKPSFQTEFLNETKIKADQDAIKVFAQNLEQLLLSPPLGEKRILAIDPGFRSGCKIVCIDGAGSLLHNETVYPHPPQKDTGMAIKKIRSLVNAYKIDAVSIGNGTASRETEALVKNISFDRDIEVYVVNEAGASVYSASKIAREEFPDYDITVRGAVSIGRRLIDPLAELVKIDPKSIGVGQYQHEVDPSRLKEKLDFVVANCVNRIGVNINTASKELLSYVSGIGPSLAENILEYRNIKGPIKSRKELLNIPRLGAKAFEQAAGFLRIKNGETILDDTAIHPESYFIVKEIAEKNNIKIEELIGNKEILEKTPLENYTGKDIGTATVKDIIIELEKPGADPRMKIKKFEFDPNVRTIEDLKENMRLPGLVNNITNFGCFVDIGIKESGLIHISNLAEGFISDVNSVVKLSQSVMVKVLEVDVERKRIQLSLKG